jgi:hypothetical protein
LQVVDQVSDEGDEDEENKDDEEDDDVTLQDCGIKGVVGAELESREVVEVVFGVDSIPGNS